MLQGLAIYDRVSLLSRIRYCLTYFDVWVSPGNDQLLRGPLPLISLIRAHVTEHC